LKYAPFSSIDKPSAGDTSRDSMNRIKKPDADLAAAIEAAKPPQNSVECVQECTGRGFSVQQCAPKCNGYTS